MSEAAVFQMPNGAGGRAAGAAKATGRRGKGARTAATARGPLVEPTDLHIPIDEQQRTDLETYARLKKTTVAALAKSNFDAFAADIARKVARYNERLAAFEANFAAELDAEEPDADDLEE